MTARERLLAKPPVVRILLKMYMSKSSLNDDEPDWEHYATEALQWWNREVAELEKQVGGQCEEELAEVIVEKLRATDVWGRILRKGTH